MKVEYMEAFIEAAKAIIHRLTKVNFEKENVQLLDQPAPSKEISIILEIGGFIEGQVIYGMNKSIAEILIDRWLYKLPSEHRKKMFKDGLSEIGNMITGRSAGILEKITKKSVLLYLVPPRIFATKDIQFNFAKLRTIVISMTSDIGEFEISIALKEMENSII